MEDMDVQRVIGKLEEGFRQITENHKLLNQTLASFSEKIQAIQQKHNAEDTQFQSEIVLRLTNVEGLLETVESHGAALVDLEKRVSDQEDTEKMKTRIKKRDINWMKVIVILVFILVGDKFTGNKFSEWVSLLFK